MARRRRQAPWTPDAARIARGLARPGNDLREWVHYGTVAALTGPDGGPNYTDENAIVISPESIDVDVVLEPLNHPVTARWGMQSGKVFMSTPIHPGDQVLVLIPMGDPSSVPEILRIITCPHNPVPTDEQGMPLFKNDRCLIYATGVPIDLRTSGGGRLLIDGNEVNANQGDKGVARVDDTVKMTLDSNDLATLGAALLATGLFTPSGVGPLPVPPPFPTFEGGEITSGSGTVKAGG